MIFPTVQNFTNLASIISTDETFMPGLEIMKILLTGFEPFGKVTDNPSQRVVEHFAAKGQANLITAVLPVEYLAASAILEDFLESYQPDAVLMLGVAQMRDSINLERIAININDAKIADNAGNLKSGQAIIEDAPAAYWSTLPLEAMYEAIQKTGIAVNYSNHAGAYLCNHVFFYARHHLETAGRGHIPCGFIHLPDMGEEAPKMPLSTIIQAIELALGALYG
jgi:pyroglutamyl-peptidase